MFELREYQKEAITAFQANKQSGIFDMATGTGKTITSLFAANEAFKKNNRQFLVIIVPFLHLIEQWAKDFSLLGIDYYLEIAYSKSHWSSKLADLVWDYNYRYRERVVIIGSYKSMANPDFQTQIAEISGDRFLIADECHYLGSSQSRKNNFLSFEAKLGLSATPRRWWDEEGTTAINKLFEKIVYSFPMEEAIEKKILTNYLYHPIVTDLTEEEISVYQEISLKISRLMGIKPLTKDLEERLKRLTMQRATLLQNAENKKGQLSSLISKQEDKRHTLVYCGKGQVDELVEMLADLGIRVHRFNSEINFKDREKILQQFSNGEIEVLVAIKCLDEGVDVPSTRVAYFMASTSNPREFIQRRGRILRRSAGKSLSVVYDFVVLPKQSELASEVFASIATKEMPRFAEFSQFALNQYKARNVVMPYLKKHHLDSLMDILPWEMYEKIKQEGVYL